MALHYEAPDSTEDVSAQVEAWSEELIKEAFFSSYFDYMTKHSARIREFVQHYQDEVDAYYALHPAPNSPLPSS